MSRLSIATTALLVFALPLSAQTDRNRRSTERLEAQRTIERQLAELEARLGSGVLTPGQLQQLYELQQRISGHERDIAERYSRMYQDRLQDMRLHSDDLALELEARLREAHELAMVDPAITADQMRAAEEALNVHELDLEAAQEAVTRVRELFDAGLEADRGRGEADFRRSLERLYGDGPKAPASAQDPADSVYRAARELLSRKQYSQAAQLFGRIREESRYARSAYRADAYYWEAFALSSEGSEEALFEAQDILGQLVRQYPEGQRHKDTNGLMTTVQVRLAQLGVPNAARQIRNMALEPVIVSEAIAATARSAEIAAQSAAVADLSDRVARAAIASPAPGVRSMRQQPQCQNDDSEIRLIALNALVRMDTAAALPILRDVLARRDECAAPLRQSSLIVVSRIRTAEAENLLLEAARTDPQPEVRRTALMHLASRNPDRAVTIAGESLRSTQDAAGQEWALQTLARMRNDAAWRLIRDFAARPENSVEARRRAIAALGQSNDSTNTAFLRDLYARVSERQLKEAILMSSAFRRTGMDVDWLLAVAQNDSEEGRLREYAISALGRRRDVGVDRFVTLYDRTTDKRVRSAILGVISDRARNDTAATDKLIAIARNEQDPDLRKRAIMGLAASDDPRARELLIEILRR